MDRRVKRQGSESGGENSAQTSQGNGGQGEVAEDAQATTSCNEEGVGAGSAVSPKGI